MLLEEEWISTQENKTYDVSKVVFEELIFIQNT